MTSVYSKSASNATEIDWFKSGFPSLSQLDALLRCVICKSHYAAPVISLACQHSFCSFCIRSFFTAASSASSDSTNRCPVCGVEVIESQLVPVPVLEELVGWYAGNAPGLNAVIKRNGNTGSNNSSGKGDRRRIHTDYEANGAMLIVDEVVQNGSNQPIEIGSQDSNGSNGYVDAQNDKKRAYENLLNDNISHNSFNSNREDEQIAKKSTRSATILSSPTSTSSYFYIPRKLTEASSSKKMKDSGRHKVATSSQNGRLKSRNLFSITDVLNKKSKDNKGSKGESSQRTTRNGLLRNALREPIVIEDVNHAESDQSVVVEISDGDGNGDGEGEEDEGDVSAVSMNTQTLEIELQKMQKNGDKEIKGKDEDFHELVDDADKFGSDLDDLDAFEAELADYADKNWMKRSADDRVKKEITYQSPLKGFMKKKGDRGNEASSNCLKYSALKIKIAGQELSVKDAVESSQNGKDDIIDSKACNGTVNMENNQININKDAANTIDPNIANANKSQLNNGVTLFESPTSRPRYLDTTTGAYNRNHSNMKKMPKLNFSLLSLPKLREKLKQHKLPAQGTKAELQDRYNYFQMLWNANLDSMHPKSRSHLMGKLSDWERIKNLDAHNKSLFKDFNDEAGNSNSSNQEEGDDGNSRNGIPLLDFVSAEERWKRKYKDEFRELVQKAKQSMKKSAVKSSDNDANEAKDVLNNSNSATNTNTSTSTSTNTSTNIARAKNDSTKKGDDQEHDASRDVDIES